MSDDNNIKNKGIFANHLHHHHKTIFSQEIDKWPSDIIEPPNNNPCHVEEVCGKKVKSLGMGSSAKVYLYEKHKKKYAVKKIRHFKEEKELVKKFTDEFCISSCFDHINVIKTFFLLKDKHGRYNVVMEYCEGDSLYHLLHVQGGDIPFECVNCYFKQLVSGVSFLHEAGVSHRDLKPANLLFYKKDFRLLKIADFGSSDVFHPPFTSAHKVKGLTGSGVYTAPEEYSQNEYDGPAVDIWSIGMIYFVMMQLKAPWKSIEDPNYALYINICYKFHDQKGIEHFDLFNKIQNDFSRSLIYKMLDPDPSTRIQMKDLIADKYFSAIKICINQQNGDALSNPPHDHSHANLPSKEL